MNRSIWRESEISQLIRQRIPILDVRAPVEFEQGHAPGSVNAPLLKNEERQIVGTLYKQQGSAAAINRGHELVSGAAREQRLNEWSVWANAHKNGAICCFRGGLRSQLVQTWLSEHGLEIPRIEGGYKALRHHCLKILNDLPVLTSMMVVAGPTGAGKTELLQSLALENCSTVDLEELAVHRGSAFGGRSTPQPTQANFENRIAFELARRLPPLSTLLVEDEGRSIGHVVIPEKLFQRMARAPTVVIEEPIERRVDRVFQQYVLNIPQNAQQRTFRQYQMALLRIARRLGGALYSEIAKDLEIATLRSWQFANHEAHRVWIEKLLVRYYDPLYAKALLGRKQQIVFCGDWPQVRGHLSEQLRAELVPTAMNLLS